MRDFAMQIREKYEWKIKVKVVLLYSMCMVTFSADVEREKHVWLCIS